mmetsp:Transcript_12709/g.37405  ORF Transcript_12709/g.37405 Transcript_12709/m.37405 type:complete len:81 (-) Transcript_12709:1756-1998(-)
MPRDERRRTALQSENGREATVGKELIGIDARHTREKTRLPLSSSISGEPSCLRALSSLPPEVTVQDFDRRDQLISTSLSL